MVINMSKSYIKLYNNGELLCAELHTNGKYKIIDSEERILLLKLAGFINKQDLSHEGYIRNEEKALNIINSYEYLRIAQICIKYLGIIPNNNIIIKSGITGNFTTQHNDKKEEDKFNLITENISNNKKESDETTPDSNEKTFNISYNSKINNENIESILQYKDIFQNISNNYGLDENLLIAISAKENDNENIDNDIMRIKKIAHLGTEYSAYNYKTEQYDSILIDEVELENIETNITIAAMIFKSCLQTFNYNIPIAIQAYNYGSDNMNQVLSMCSELESISIEDLVNDQSNNKWLDYRELLQTGDSKYIEHVLNYLNSDKITVLNDEGQQISININNEFTN